MAHKEITLKICNDCGGIGITIDSQELFALYQLNVKMEKIMSELTDLQTKVDAAAAQVLKALSDAAAKLQALAAVIAANPTPADLATVTADLNTQADALSAAAAAMETQVASTP